MEMTSVAMILMWEEKRKGSSMTDTGRSETRESNVQSSNIT